MNGGHQSDNFLLPGFHRSSDERPWTGVKDAGVNKVLIADDQPAALWAAQPFSSAKDPVNVAGFVADNILSGIMRIIHWHELESLDHENLFLLDVRTPGEYRLGTIEGAVNIPHTELRDRLHEIPADKKVVVFCHVGYRAYIAYRILHQSGYDDVRNLSGGYKTYELATGEQGNEGLFEHEFIDRDDVICQAAETVAAVSPGQG